MTVTVNCGTGGRQPRREKICRVFDDESGQDCHITASHEGAGRGNLRVEVHSCHGGAEVFSPT